jgi:hypothetical protein
MELASTFIAVLIVALVTVSQATTLNTRIVRKWNGDETNQPSQWILDAVAAMSTAGRVSTSPTLSVAPTSVTHKKSDVPPSRQSAKERISA